MNLLTGTFSSVGHWACSMAVQHSLRQLGTNSWVEESVFAIKSWGLPSNSWIWTLLLLRCVGCAEVISRNSQRVADNWVSLTRISSWHRDCNLEGGCGWVRKGVAGSEIHCKGCFGVCFYSSLVDSVTVKFHWLNFEPNVIVIDQRRYMECLMN